MQIATHIAVPWHRREDHIRLRSSLVHPTLIPESYDQWLQETESRADEIRRSLEVVVVPVSIDPDAFVIWCSGRGRKADTVHLEVYAALLLAGINLLNFAQAAGRLCNGERGET